MVLYWYLAVSGTLAVICAELLHGHEIRADPMFDPPTHRERMCEAWKALLLVEYTAAMAKDVSANA